MKNLRVYVLADKDGQDCTNGGVTSRHDRMMLLWECSRQEAVDYANEHGIDIDECLWLKPRDLWGKDHAIAVPLIHQTDKVGPMFGGNFVYTSDSRLYRMGGWLHVPIAVHDRYETEEEYRVLST